MDICDRSAQRPGARVSLLWREQAGIDLEGSKEKGKEEAMDLESNSYSGRDESSGASG